MLGGVLVALAAWSGGYGQTAIGWSALLGLWALLLSALLVGRGVPRELLAMETLLCALVMWTFLSVSWSFSAPSTLLGAERSLVYAGGIGALVMAIRRERWFVVTQAVVLAASVVTVVALARYLLFRPELDATQGHLLFRPVGYANALGGFVALPIPILVGFAVGGRRRIDRAASALLVPAAAALYLTASRAAWLGAVVGVGYWLIRCRPRPAVPALTAALVVPGGTIVLLWLLRSADASSGLEARRLAGAAAIAAAALVATTSPSIGRRLGRFQAPVGGHAVVVCAAAAGAAIVGVRLFTSGLGDRSAYWRTAAHMFLHAPVVGTGAGSFAAKWLELRTIDRDVLYAHNVYLETLAELGIVGFCLLGAVLCVPLVGARRRTESTLCAMVGSYLVYLVHAFFEWDWQMPALTIAALALGAAIVAATAQPGAVVLRAPARALTVVATVAGIAFAVVSLVGHSNVVSAEHRLRDGDPAAAERTAKRAARVIPWAAEPWAVLGDARLRAGRVAEARAAYRHAIANDPHDWQAWLRLAAASNGAEARRASDRAAALDPRAFDRRP